MGLEAIDEKIERVKRVEEKITREEAKEMRLRKYKERK